jgi:hypothetical protein
MRIKVKIRELGSRRIIMSEMAVSIQAISHSKVGGEVT